MPKSHPNSGDVLLTVSPIHHCGGDGWSDFKIFILSLDFSMLQVRK